MGWQDRDYYRDASENSEHPFRGQFSTMSVTTWLLIINCAVFVLDAIFTGSQRANALSLFYWGNFNIKQGVYELQAWRWVSYQFLHGGILHLVFNMIGLYFFGPMVERWWGARRFIAFYLLCGVSGAVVFTLLTFTGTLPTWMGSRLIGASGAVYGILMAAALVAPNMRVMLLFPPIPMKLRTMAAVFLGLATLSILVGSANAGGEAAHLGGALLGYLMVKQPWLINWAQGSAARRSLREKYAGWGDASNTQSDSGGTSKGGGSWSELRWARKKEKELKEKQQREAEVDRILAKVKEQGLHSLTTQEKKTLTMATQSQQEP